MLTYIEMLLYFIVPPIAVLAALYWPMMGRREVLKLSWLILMATIYTTPWDNFIIARGGWAYPAGSVLATIKYIPMEEHMFFILQPIFIVLLHSVLTHSTLLPFEIPQSTLRRLQSQEPNAEPELKLKNSQSPARVQTLRRRPLAACLWLVEFIAGLYLVNDAHGAFPELVVPEWSLGMKGFYLGWIMVWISPVLGWLTYLGSNMQMADWKTLIVGGGWLWAVDTIAIRNGAWSIATETSLGVEVWRGLPLEEFLFFLFTTYLIVISTSLISHLHTLMVLSPDLPPCPPTNLAAHIQFLARIAFNPPLVDEETLMGLVHAEQALRKGSKSFDVAKLAFGREMRIGLVAVYAWCRMTDNIVDDAETFEIHEKKVEYLAAIKAHVIKSYEPGMTRETLDSILEYLPLSPADRTVFHAFSNLIPRLVPFFPFLELCNGYETDLKFAHKSTKTTSPPWNSMPIVTEKDMLCYADDVAGSVASACCYLAWSILSPCLNEENSLRPGDEHFAGAKASSPKTVTDKTTITGVVPRGKQIAARRETILSNARQMGWALQLVNIARDVKKDALNNRIYIPRGSFADNETILTFLHPQPGKPTTSTRPYVKKYLRLAFEFREQTAPYMEALPRESRGGLRAMVASYFEIAEEIMRRDGEVEETGVKVSSWRRLRAASSAMWGFA